MLAAPNDSGRGAVDLMVTPEPPLLIVDLRDPVLIDKDSLGELLHRRCDGGLLDPM